MKLATETWSCSKSSIAALTALFLMVSIWETRALAAPAQRERSDRKAHKRSAQKTNKRKSKALASGAESHLVPMDENPFKCPVSPAAVPLRLKPVVTESAPFVGSKVYRPKDKGKYLSIVLLHGSEGGSAGFNYQEAKSLAHRGYPVLALCYFDCARKRNTPRATLKDVEATKVLDAVDWLRQQPFSNGKVVVYGASRGAELTLIAGSLDEARRLPDALVAHSPSDTFKNAFNSSWVDPRCWVCRKDHCQSEKPSPESDLSWDPKCGLDDPHRMDRSKSAWLINGTSVPNETRIPIEKFNGPILLTVGEKDEMWSPDQTRRIEATLKEAGRKPEVYYFPDAGHVFENESDAGCSSTLLLDFLGKVGKAGAPTPTPRPASRGRS